MHWASANIVVSGAIQAGYQLPSQFRPLCLGKRQGVVSQDFEVFAPLRSCDAMMGFGAT